MLTHPRLALGCFPTPLQVLENVGKELGIELTIKRDDLSGLAAGGNKVRKLEYLVADAKRREATVLITAGAIQSNHVVQTVAAARKSGLRAIAVLQGPRPSKSTGNLLLGELLGAEIDFVDSLRFFEEVPRYMAEREQELLKVGERPYVIPTGGSNALGALGYVNCVRELAIQYAKRGIEPPDYLVASTGSVGTYAGLVVGGACHWPATKILGVVVTTNYFAQRENVLRLVNETAALAGIERRWNPDELWLDYDYIGPGYSVQSEQGARAIELVARSEGVFLDPTYTAKVFAGLVGNVQSGRLPPSSRVLFVHTGGSTALLSN